MSSFGNAGFGDRGFGEADSSSPPSLTITPDLIVSTSTVYAPTVTGGSLAVTPALIVSATTFFAPTISTAASTLTLNDVKAYRVYQRSKDGSNTRSIMVSGTYTGTIVGTVQARVVMNGTSTVVKDWTALGGFVANGGAGTWSGALTVACGGWYNLQVRDSGAPTNVSNGTANWGVGVNIALLGQSNMAKGYTLTNPLGAKSPLASHYAYRGWKWIFDYVINDAIPGDYHSDYGTGTAGFGDTIQIFARTLVAQLGMPVGCIEAAISGSAITSWLTTDPNTGVVGTSWANFAASGEGTSGTDPAGMLTTDQSEGDFEIALWYQGETETLNGVTGAQYTGYLTQVHNQLRAMTGRTGAQLRFGVTPISGNQDPGTGAGPGATDAQIEKIRRVQLDYIAANSGAGVFYAAFTGDMDETNQAPHFTDNSYYRLFARFTQSVLKTLGLAAYGTGPYISGMSAATGSHQVVVQVTHDTGTLLQDMAGDTTGANVRGFVVNRNGSPVTVSAVAFAQPDKILLTLPGAALVPTDALTVQYVLGNGAYNYQQSPQTNYVYDNVPPSVSTEAFGMPLQQTDGPMSVIVGAIYPPVIISPTTVYPPGVSGGVSPATIISNAIVYPPVIVVASPPITPILIVSPGTVFAPSIPGSIVPALIGSATTVFAPIVNQTSSPLVIDPRYLIDVGASRLGAELPAVTPNMRVPISFDFTAFMDADEDEAVASVIFTSRIVRGGSDPTVANRVSGAALETGAVVTQWCDGFVGGVIYLISAVATTSLGQVLEYWATLPCTAPPVGSA